MIRNAIQAALTITALSAPTLGATQEPLPFKLPPPRVSCNAASGLLDQLGNVVPGSLRKRCDTLWTYSLQNGGVGPWSYGDFIGQCAQSCPAPKPLSQASSVPQLNALGTQAAQSAAGGAGASGAAAAGGGGFSTALLVVGGVAGAAGIGAAVATASSGTPDRPASP